MSSAFLIEQSRKDGEGKDRIDNETPGLTLAREEERGGSQSEERQPEDAANREEGEDRDRLDGAADLTDEERARRRTSERGGSQSSDQAAEDCGTDRTEDDRDRGPAERGGSQASDAQEDPPPRTSGPGLQQETALVHASGNSYPGAARINR